MSSSDRLGLAIVAIIALVILAFGAMDLARDIYAPKPAVKAKP